MPELSLQNEEGILPDCELLANANKTKLDIDPIVEGSVPVSRLFRIDKEVSAANEDILLGIAPYKLLLLRWMAIRDVINDNDEGMLCDNLLFLKYMDCNTVNAPNSQGIGPVSLLNARLRYCKLTNFPMEDGKDPVSEL